MSKLINTASGEVETVTATKTFDVDVTGGTVTVCIGSYTLPSGAWQAPDVAASITTTTVTFGLTFGNGHLNPVAGRYFFLQAATGSG